MPLLARLRDLPWSVLALEFVVVVLGILGALAVDSWWTALGERRVETIYLVRLQRDLSRSLESLRPDIEGHREISENLRAVLEELQTGPDPEGIEVVAEGIAHADNMVIWFPYHSTYEELIATGNLGLISSDTLRQALGAYDRQVRDNLDWDEWLEDLWIATIVPLFYKHAIVSDFATPEFRARIVAPSPFETDLESFYENRDLWNVLTMKLDAEQGISEARGRLLQALETALALTEAELDARGRSGR